MSSSPDHSAPALDHGYGGGGRTSRPLIALIPIGIAMVLALAMLAEGLHVMLTPDDASAGVAHVAQTTAPTSGPGAPS